MVNEQVLRDILVERILNFLWDFDDIRDAEAELEMDQHKPSGFIWRLAAELEDFV